jgi:hypothetical protein
MADGAAFAIAGFARGWRDPIGSWASRAAAAAAATCRQNITGSSSGSTAIP